jgi:hypothetical protein
MPLCSHRISGNLLCPQNGKTQPEPRDHNPARIEPPEWGTKSAGSIKASTPILKIPVPPVEGIGEFLAFRTMLTECCSGYLSAD